MPSFGRESRQKLSGVDPRLASWAERVVKGFDCKVIYGHRTPEEQFDLYRRGRQYDEARGLWVIENKLEVVTYRDGTKLVSKHNLWPALAIDLVPYPVAWRDTERFYYFGGYGRRVAEEMGLAVVWGGDWDGDTEVDDQTFMDLAHWEIA